LETVRDGDTHKNVAYRPAVSDIETCRSIQCLKAF